MVKIEGKWVISGMKRKEVATRLCALPFLHDSDCQLRNREKDT